MSFGQFLAILQSRWKGCLLLFALTVLSTIVVTLLLHQQYTATASVVMDAKPDPVAAMMYGNATPASLIGTQVEVMQSERVGRRVIQDLKLVDIPSVRAQWQSATGGEGSIESWLLEEMQKRLDVKPSREAGVISVSYRATDPATAARLANAFVQAHIETTLDLRVESAKQYSSFFDSSAKEARSALEKAQTRLSDFQNANGIVAMDERYDIENARLSELSTQAVVLQGLASESGSRQSQARGAEGDRMQEVLGNPVIVGLKADLSREEGRLEELNARLGSRHPQVQEANANIRSLRARLATETERLRQSIGLSDNIARQRSADVKAALDAQRAKVLRLKALRDQGAVLARDVENSQHAYEAVVARFNQASLESRATQSNVSVLTVAELPLKPSSPKILVNLALAVMLGGVLAIGGALLLELMNRRVRTPQDVSANLGLNVIGMLQLPQTRKLFGRFDTSALSRQRVIGVTGKGRGRGRPQEPARFTDVRSDQFTDSNSEPLQGQSRADRPIGELIAESLRLSDDQVQSISDLQRSTGTRFGEAAIELGLATQDDVLVALSQQYQYPYAAKEQRQRTPELITLTQPFSAQAESFRSIRSQLLKRVFNNRSGKRRALAVVSPNAGDGKTYFAANLAVSLAQLGGRTLLIDADLRGPRQHEVFKLNSAYGLSYMLSGRITRNVVQPAGVPGLFVLPAGNTPPNPLELIERPAFGLLLDELTSRFDHVVVDTPAADYGTDASVIAERCGATLVLARRDVSRLADIEGMAAEFLEDDQIKLTGVVINHYAT